MRADRHSAIPRPLCGRVADALAARYDQFIGPESVDMGANRQPISRESLDDEIRRGVTKMDARQVSFWRAIKVVPTKWQLHPWGDQGGGF